MEHGEDVGEPETTEQTPLEFPFQSTRDTGKRTCHFKHPPGKLPGFVVGGATGTDTDETDGGDEDESEQSAEEESESDEGDRVGEWEKHLAAEVAADLVTTPNCPSPRAQLR